MLLCDSYITFLIEAKVVNLPEVTSDRAFDDVTHCRGGPMCPPILIEAQYDLWADTQVRPYVTTSRCTTTYTLSISFSVSLGQ